MRMSARFGALSTLALSAALASVPTRPVAADWCGTVDLTGDSGANRVILGRYDRYICDPNPDIGCYFWPTSNLAACWQDDSGAWHLDVVTGCTTSTPSDHQVLVETGAGDDQLQVLRDGIGGSSAYCTPYCSDGRLAAWPSNFDFGIYAKMGAGGDQFWGSPNDDLAISNDWSWSADLHVDELCGHDGSDQLNGDGDDSPADPQEYLDGGSGYDYCNGDGGNSGASSTGDVAGSCEYPQDATIDAEMNFCEAETDLMPDRSFCW